MQRGRRWCFTWNNYDEEEALNKLTSLTKIGWVKRLIAGRETAPFTGTKHLQGYIHYSKALRMNQVKADLHPTVHLEVARASEKDNIEYCSKAEDLMIDWTHPVYNEQEEAKNWTKRQDKQEETRELLESYLKMTTDAFEALYPYQAFHWANKLRDWRISHTALLKPWGGQLHVKNFWIWGEPGCGKSKWARSATDEYPSYPKNLNKWWDGYDPSAHRSVIIEDIDPSHGKWAAQFMKVWSDRYRFLGETKGSGVMVQPGTYFLIVTSNYSIDQVFEEAPLDKDAIRRRFYEHYCTGPQDLWLWNKILDWDILQKPGIVEAADNQE